MKSFNKRYSRSREHADLATRRIRVRESVTVHSRAKAPVVPVLDSLLPILTDWKLRTLA